MPVFQRFTDCSVRINYKDHPPPHFHVLLNDGREALVDIHRLEIIRESVQRRELAKVLAWAGERQACLLRLFEDFQQ